jgi:hypothetical protein
MRVCQRVLVLLVVCTLIAPASSVAQASPDSDVWRTFVENVPTGTELNVRLRSGQRFRATVVRPTADAVMLLPKTRLPVPVQAVAYEEVVSLERHERSGLSSGKAAAIGVASGVGAFFAGMLIVLALVGD